MREELKKVCQFWADKGVDGLRLDVINLVSKQQDFRPTARAMAAASTPTARAFTRVPAEMSRDVSQPRGLMTVGDVLHHA